MVSGGPSFVCIGQQRCGTSWLYEALGRHPQVALPPMKAIRYFVRESDRPLIAAKEGLRSQTQRRKIRRLLRSGQINRSTASWFARYYLKPRNDDWYNSLLRPPPDKISGEICHSYSGMTDDQLRRMYASYPDLKLILLVREPLSRCWSGLARRLAAREGIAIDSKWETGKIMALLKDTGAVERSNYAATIERFQAVYPQNQLFVGFHDQLRDEPMEFMNTLCRWLGIGDYDAVTNDALPHAKGGAKYPSMPVGVRESLAAELSAPTERLFDVLANPYSEAWHAELTRLEG